MTVHRCDWAMAPQLVLVARLPPAGGAHNLPLRKVPRAVPFHGRAELSPQACVWAGLCRWSALHSCPVTLVLQTRCPRWWCEPGPSRRAELWPVGLVELLSFLCCSIKCTLSTGYLFCVAELSAKVPGDSQWHLTPQPLIYRITRLICISG